MEPEIWERDEILFIIKFEPYARNKTLFWDLDAKNHEVTLLKIKHIHLKESEPGQTQVSKSNKSHYFEAM